MNMQVLEARRDVSGGYKVDVTRGQRVSRVSSEWFSRPDDERYLSLSELARTVRERSERTCNDLNRIGHVYDVITASTNGGEIRTSPGLQISTVPIASIDPDEIDTLIVPGGSDGGNACTTFLYLDSLDDAEQPTAPAVPGEKPKAKAGSAAKSKTPAGKPADKRTGKSLSQDTTLVTILRGA